MAYATTNLFNVPYTIPNGSNQTAKPAAGKPAPKAPSANGTYWVGQNGLVYVNGANGVNSAGKADANTDKYWSSKGFNRVDDWNANSGGKQTAQAVDLSGGGGGGGTTYKDTSAARGATQKNIDAVDVGLNNSLLGIGSEFDRMMKQYADEEALNDQAYTTQVTSNENTRQNNVQSSLLSGAQGSKGLRATLSALGAYGGTGKVLANRAVASETNKDIGAGDKVFEANATQLNTAKAKTDQDEENRKNEARAAKSSQEAAAKREAAKNKQSLYKDMAGLFGDAGNTGEANRYTGMVGDLAKDVVGGPITAAAYTPRNVTFEAGDIKSYLAGANDMTVSTTPSGTPLNSPLSGLTSKRRREEEVI